MIIFWLRLNNYWKNFKNLLLSEKYNPKNVLLKGQRFVESKKEEKRKSQPEEAIAERAKLRRQASDKNLFETSSPYTGDDSD